MARLFGTDGVRGVANTELTGELAFRLGRAGAYVLTKETKHAPRILVAMDTRISGDMLESALVSGNAVLKDQAVARGTALVSNNAEVGGKAIVQDYAIVLEGYVSGNTHI